MGCEECEKIRLEHPGALCGPCAGIVKTFYEEDARLIGAWCEQCRKAEAEVERLRRGYDEYMGQIDPVKILSALHVAERERDEAQAKLAEARRFEDASESDFKVECAAHEETKAEVARLRANICALVEAGDLLVPLHLSHGIPCNEWAEAKRKAGV